MILRTVLRFKPGAAFLGVWIILCMTYLASPSINIHKQLFHNARGYLKPGATEIESQLRDGVRRFDRISSRTEPDLLILTLTRGETSWGLNDPDEPRRTLNDFLSLLQSTKIDTKRITLGMLTSSEEQYEMIKSATSNLEFGRVTLFLHNGFDDKLGSGRDDRHDDELQMARRSELAKLRNYLLLQTLQEEPHIVWLDADVFYMDEGIIQKMISTSEQREEAGMITAHCQYGNEIESNYDLNAWSGTRQGPRGWDLTDEEIAAGELDKQGQYHIDDLLGGTTDEDLIALDTVGATLLYMRASLVWQGLTFPSQYVVGTRWQKDGWDGIESEGLCYSARSLKGGSCFTLGGNWRVAHTYG